jgi:hypothetical protein
MEHGQNKHGPERDDELKREIENELRAAHGIRAEEWREAEPGSDEDRPPAAPEHGHGVDPRELDEPALLRELEQLHAPADALGEHTRRTARLEGEYLQRHPRREVRADRTRAGARARTRPGR